MHKIFVYGTLMRGESNEHVMKHARFIGEGTTPGSVYGYGYAPGAVRPDHKAHRGGLIHGELYEVPEGTKQILDMLEGVEHGNYTLTPVKVTMDAGLETGDGSVEEDAEIYFHNHYREYGSYNAERWKPEF